MLAAARRRAAAAGSSLELVEGDMRDFDLGREFDFIFIARNSLLHVSSAEDLVATFAAVRRHLAPGEAQRCLKGRGCCLVDSNADRAEARVPPAGQP